MVIASTATEEEKKKGMLEYLSIFGKK